MTIRVVPLHSIHVDNSLNVSRDGVPISDSDAAPLADDVATHGLLEEVGVITVHHARWLTYEETSNLRRIGVDWILIYGFRRFKACQIAGFTNIKITEVADEPITLAQAELSNVAENWGRKPPTDYSLSVACHRFIKHHGITVQVVAQRTQKSIRFVEECVAIVERVKPTLLQAYRANCTNDTRRKMLDLASVDGATDVERFDNQEKRWEELELPVAEDRMTNPDAGIRKKGNGKQSTNTVATKRELLVFSERVITASKYHDGTARRPMTNDVRAALISMARWDLNPSTEPVPVQ